ncbi:MAG TPA: radical SAM family heme chaperone HemW, partial [Waddliaceae bacterium]
CDYCHFYVLPDKQVFKDRLMEGLHSEWRSCSDILKGKKLRSIYFGGGTPTLLGPRYIQFILSWIREYFGNIENLQITLEANPEEINHSLIQSYVEAGVNRVSIGIQSLDDRLLQLLSRQHSADKAINAVHTVSGAGISNISVDLMYDLPQQTIESWETTLKRVRDLPLSHLSLYNLTIEPHTVFFKRQESIKKHLPDEDTSLKMYEMAIQEFEENGLQQYEISAFHREGFYSKHNVGYWIGRPFLGLGPSAFSYWQGKRFRNVANLHKYCRALTAGESAIDFEEELLDKAKIRELLAINLRLREGVDLHHFEMRHGRHGRLDKELLAAITNLQEDGFLFQSAGHISLTYKGMLFYDTVASQII